MKRLVLATIIFLALAGVLFAENPACISSGLQTSDGAVMASTSTTNHCLCGVQLIPAAAASTLILYDNSAASGTVLIKLKADASGTATGYAPNGNCITVNKGIYADVDGASAAYVVWYR